MKKLLSLFSTLCLFATVMAADESVRVQCPLGTMVTRLTPGVPVSYKVSIYASSGVKSVKWTGLPSGLKYNAKTGNIEGAASKAGKVSVKGTWDDFDGNPHKVSLSSGFLIPSLWCTSSTSYFTAYIPWPADNDVWLEYVKCTSNGIWSWDQEL